MASQYNSDIPFSSSHNQQAFKLLELPPELLALMESDDPPTYAILTPSKASLTMESLTITSSTATETTPGYATLCYGEKKYQMRQKNTSNPLMILQPSITEPTEADDAETFIPKPSITAIAKIEDTIELILQESVAKAQPKVNKWHEKFAKSRLEKKG